ncbi:hypothetical protein Areg01_55540 [Actinoplanes regularis]|nr:hypothetical protein Areg01_55540 [Actinoplanes regularis]
MTITTAPARIESLLRGDARQIPGTVRSLNGARFAESGKERKPILRYDRWKSRLQPSRAKPRASISRGAPRPGAWRCRASLARDVAREGWRRYSIRSYRGMVCGFGNDGVEWAQAGLRACRV